jgi:5'-nucleotidase
MTLLRILVTNDDGVRSPGLGLLAACLAADRHDVFVVAPAVESSGSATAVGDIVDGAQIVTRSVVLPDAPSVPAFAVDGPPGRCVLVAAGGAFGPPPDLVLSGINPGANVGRFLQLHSGTLGAVLTAAGFGMSGMAVSIAGSSPRHWATAATTAARLVDYLHGCEPRTSLNLNIPDLPIEQILGLRTARVGGGARKRLALSGSAPGTLTISWVDRPSNGTPVENDSSLVKTGYATLTRVVAPATGEPEPFPDLFRK